MTALAAIGLCALVLACGCAGGAAVPAHWRIDRLDSIGGHRTTVVGEPKVAGKAVEFDGVKDGLLVENHPLAGWSEFTVEIVFRPDAGGPKEQRFLHLHGEGTDDRLLIETRLTDDGRWFLDTFVKSGPAEQTFFAKDFLHPVGGWHVAALVYDGKEMRHYVDGILEMSAPNRFAPFRPGRTSLGVRANRVFWFKGAIREVRFTPKALVPGEFLRP